MQKKQTALTQSGPWEKQAGIPDSAIDSASQKMWQSGGYSPTAQAPRSRQLRNPSATSPFPRRLPAVCSRYWWTSRLYLSDLIFSYPITIRGQCQLRFKKKI